MTDSIVTARHARRATVALIVLAAAGAALAQPDERASESRWFRNVRQLTSKKMGLDRSGEAYFSPDVKRIAFLAYPAGKTEYQTYVMNLDGTGLKMVSTGEGATTCPYFHPDGKRLLFAANHLDQRRPADPDDGCPMRPGSSQANSEPAAEQTGEHPQGPPGGHPSSHRPRSGYVWTYFPGMDLFEYTFETGELRRLTDTDGYDAECAYSPDGKHIVFSSFRDYDQEIYICDSDGHYPRRITYAKGKDGGPFFSPDGKRICYRSDRAGTGNLQIFINSIEGTDERAITGNDALNWAPFWHPSGKWLIFTRADFREGRNVNFDLYLIRDDGSETHRVTFDREFDGLPVFSPDGRQLMWTSKRNGLDAPQIFMADFIGLTPDGELRFAEQ